MIKNLNTPPSFQHPSQQAIEHSLQVFAHLKQKIQAHQGFLPFDHYLETVLYAPGLGYYMTGTERFGTSGDFITAPEISPLFGYSIAEKLLTVLKNLSDPVILEVGAGTGKLALDILTHLQSRTHTLPKYWILELSPDAKARQAKTLEPFLSQVIFLDAVPEAAFDGIILGNEVLDALPFSCYELQYELQNDGLQKSKILERGVGLDPHSNTLIWKTRPSSISAPPGLNLERSSEKYPKNYQFEICHRAQPFLQALTRPLRTGAFLMLDYGHLSQELYHPSRVLGTYQCHYQHHAHDNPFFYPGLQDITAHVNFDTVIDTLAQQGFSEIQYQTQMHFLLENKIDTLIHSPPTKEERNALRRLLLPEMMGESFKAVWALKS